MALTGLAAIAADDALSDEITEIGGVPMPQDRESEVTESSSAPMVETGDTPTDLWSAWSLLRTTGQLPDAAAAFR